MLNYDLNYILNIGAQDIYESCNSYFKIRF